MHCKHLKIWRKLESKHGFRPGLCLSEQESANSFEFCKSLRCKSPRPLLGAKLFRFPQFCTYWERAGPTTLSRLGLFKLDAPLKVFVHPQNIFNSWEGFLFQWTSHILNQKFFHFHFHKCHSPFHRYSKDNNLSGSNSPMNSFLRRFLSFS